MKQNIFSNFKKEVFERGNMKIVGYLIFEIVMVFLLIYTYIWCFKVVTGIYGDKKDKKN